MLRATDLGTAANVAQLVALAPLYTAAGAGALRAAVAGFAGRAAELEELARLLEEPAVPGGAVVISAIEGTAGIGKTALAVQ